MKKGRRQSRITMSERVYAILLSLCLVVGVGVSFVRAEDKIIRKLQNGSFEEGQTFTDAYKQTKEVANWKTTAFEGKFELFTENPGTYLDNPNVRLKPTDGTYAAELNADEESTLYQVVNTTASSVYEWGLDHGGRTTKDVMALVIGPNQDQAPSKPIKAGRDQFMQMVDWLNSDANSSIKDEISAITAGAEPKQYTVYSKKFAAKGTFYDNAGNNAFSLTPSKIYTEEWHIWIMASSRGTDGSKPNPWNSYGSNAEGSAGSGNSNGSTTVDLSKYYLYTVPAGQTETLFGFVSISSVKQGPTFGNFLDNINFQLYHVLSGSTSTHGSALISGSDGTVGGEGGSNGHEVTVGGKLATYITDGEKLKIQAVVKKADVEDGCEFVGVYRTKLDENGNLVTTFIKLAGNDEWVKSTNASGDIIYTYYLEGITSATDLHFVFIKSPTITYDPNGGKDYVVKRTYNTDEAANVYSFKPATLVGNTSGVDAVTGATQKQTFISPYESKAAECPDDSDPYSWKFMGWKLTGDTVNADLGSEQPTEGALETLLPAKHTIACDYHCDGVTLTGGIKDTKAQYFKIYKGNVSPPLFGKIDKDASGVYKGVTWQDNGTPKAEVLYANVHRGLTMVAQWRWRQAFIPQTASESKYTESDSGGTVEITKVTKKPEGETLNTSYGDNGGKVYYATTDETITIEAKEKPGYIFEGWYYKDGDGKYQLLTTNATYTYTEAKEGVNTYYARFSGRVTQTYIRQVKNGDTWDTIEGTADNPVGNLGRYEYIDAPGMPISSTAKAGTGYVFVGWYYKEGDEYKPVDASKLTNNGTTISYTTTTEDATYYARFETAYTVKFVSQTKQANGSFKTDTVGGKVSVASVTDAEGRSASSMATANANYKFLGWYDKDGKQLSADATYSPTITAATNNVTYYARFEIEYKSTVKNKVYLSFVAESADVQIPSVFDGRDAGTGKNTSEYGLNNKFGNTISTGFKYSLNTTTDVKTIQITVTVPASAYVKVGGTGSFTGNGTPILTDGDSVKYNKGSIQQISGTTTLTYYWDATGLQANTTYGFIIDNLYAPGATATITVNGKDGTQVTSDNGVVNAAAGNYRANSHYSK